MIKFLLIIIILGLGAFSQAKNCTQLSNTYNSYFINGVGNDSLTIQDSTNAIKRKLGIKEVIPLVNPKNEGAGDILFKNNFKDDFTWGEIKEVFNQKLQEILKSKIIDEKTVKDMYSQIDDTKVNLIFAHSQGNLYSNSLCKLNNGRKKQMTISIASPAASVDCGDKDSYVTLEEDSVIGILREITKIDPLTKNPLPPNAKISNLGSLGCPKSDLRCHGLVETYLMVPVTLNKIKSLYKKNLDVIEDQELNFNLIEIKLSEIKQEDKNILSSTKDSVQSSYTKLSMTYRKNMASLRTVSYLANVFNSSFITSIMNLDMTGLSKKNLNKVLNQEIEADSDQDYADLVGYVIDNIHPYCLRNASLMPTNLYNYCKNYVPYYTITEFTDNSQFNKFSLESKGMIWNNSNRSLVLSCKDALKTNQSKEMIVNLKYAPQQGVISSVSVNGLNYDIYPKNLSNKAIESESVAKISLSVSEGKYTYSLNRTKDFLNYKKMNSLVGNDFVKCNSLNKLFSNNCKNYMTMILTSK
jgi:hypothetical protein